MMNWVQPKFNDFHAPGPPRKKQKISDAITCKAKIAKTAVGNKGALINKCKLKSKCELIVNNKKVGEVESWLKNLDRNESNTVIISGPPGCGKMTTLQIICKELNIGISEWITPATGEFSTTNKEYSVPYTSQQKAFEDFIIRACRYSSLLTPSNNKRLVVVKDIPTVFFKDTSSFHEFVNRYQQLKDINVVFIISDTTVQNELFPLEFRSNCGIKCISFNPLTKKSIFNRLQAILNNSGLPFDKDSVNAISESCNGDLRNAISSLNILTTDCNFTELRNELKQVSKSYNVHSIQVDPSIDLFHGLGRVLYVKRDEKKNLVYNPNDIASAFSSCPNLFIGMLQENYLTTFSDIQKIKVAANSLSLSDYLLQDRKDPLFSEQCSIAVAVHGLMVTNENPIKKFQSFNKPIRLRADNLNRTLKDCASARFNTINVSTILLDSVSYLKLIPQSSSTHEERKLISDLCNFNLLKSCK